MIGKIKWVLIKYETWFNFFLALFMNGCKWDKRDLEKSSLGEHLYPLINKAKKKSNQVSYLVSTHLTFPFPYALFMNWINETLKVDWWKTCRMLIVGVINLCKGNFMPCIFYINTWKLYIQKHYIISCWSRPTTMWSKVFC